MSDANSDGIWEGTVTFPVGTPFALEYKFTHTMDGSTWEWENNIVNRTLTLSDANPNVTLAPVLFDDYFCPPTLDINYVSGQAQLNWSPVPLATSYNIYSAAAGYPTPATLEGSTAGTSFSQPATIGTKCYVVKAAR
jgi:hypothetical protein